jgi:hypothetical protein
MYFQQNIGGAVNMIIKNGGNVGIGTTSPDDKLTVFETGGSTTSTIKLDSNGNAIKGHLGIFNNNHYISSNWYYNGSQNADSLSYGQAAIVLETNTASGNILFQTSSAGATVPVTRATITSGGELNIENNFSIGTSSKGIILSKYNVGGKYALFSDNNQYLFLGVTEYNSWERVYAIATSNGVYLTNGATSWTANSDERLKNINSNIENAVDKLSTLRTVKYSWKSDELNREYLGLIAQDVQKVLPEVVDVENNEEKTLGVRYTELVPVLVKAIQELKAEIDELKAK